MGFFWAEAEPAPSPAKSSKTNTFMASLSDPPPSCPMHNTQKALTTRESKPAGESGTCPYEGPNSNSTNPKEPRSSSISALNPLNWMPRDLSQTRESGLQKKHLPIEREISSIPRGVSEDDQSAGNWEYPSPQQMYNALLRKGFTETPEDAVESMVAIHNFLNEGAWAEIVEWERRFGKGLREGWRESRFGEEGSQAGAVAMATKNQATAPPKLIRFMGKSGEVTPKARMIQLLGWVYPAKFGGPPPFDRHDWFVERPSANGRPRQVRYVIDYYSGPPEPTGQPVFYLDIRPALDRPAAPVERLIRWSRDIWWRASGARAREQLPS